MASGIFYLKNGVSAPHDEAFVWPSPSASPFPKYSASPTPTPVETPSAEATTLVPEDTITPTPSPTQSKTPAPTHSPSPRPRETTASPTSTPLDVEVTDSRYYSTGRHSGIAQIDSETKGSNGETEHSHSSEFNLQCGAYVVKIGVVSFTDGEQDISKKSAQHPELTATLCDGNEVDRDLQGDPGKFARYLLPLANIP